MRTVLTCGNEKHAALYFERVIPVEFSAGPPSPWLPGGEVPPEVLPSLLLGPAHRSFDHVSRERVAKASRIYLSTVIPVAASLPDDDPLAALDPAGAVDMGLWMMRAYLNDDPIPGNAHHALAVLASYLESLDADRLDNVLVPSSVAGLAPPGQDFAVSILNAPIVDISSASWNQVLELRRDQDAQAKLRRFRAFFEANFAGKSLPFIEDDLARRLDEHNAAAKKHGFDLSVGTLSSFIGAANVQAAVSAGVVAALLGGPEVGLASAAAVEVAGMALEFAKKKRLIKDWSELHDLAYVIHVKKVLERSQGTASDA